jgi:hypothetical protein
MYLKKPSSDPTGFHCYKIRLKRDNKRLGFDVIESLGEYKAKKWEMIQYSIVRAHIRLITDILMLNSSFFVAHSNIISVYNLREEKWV